MRELFSEKHTTTDRQTDFVVRKGMLTGLSRNPAFKRK